MTRNDVTNHLNDSHHTDDDQGPMMTKTSKFKRVKVKVNL